MKRLALILAFLPLCPAQDAKRPRILGVAHVSLFVSDLQKARAFYKDYLGFEEPVSGLIGINHRQHIELVVEAPRNGGQLDHIAFYTDDAKTMHEYLASRGVKLPIADPDGHRVEFVQYEPGSRRAGATGVSDRIGHIGVLTRDTERALKFYRDILGFQGSDGDKWRVPDGEDSLELGLNRKQPTPDRLNIKNHICFDSADVAKVVATLRARAALEIEVHETSTGKRVANLYDPDGSRIEFMENRGRSTHSSFLPSGTAFMPWKKVAQPSGCESLLGGTAFRPWTKMGNEYSVPGLMER